MSHCIKGYLTWLESRQWFNTHLFTVMKLRYFDTINNNMNIDRDPQESVADSWCRYIIMLNSEYRPVNTVDASPAIRARWTTAFIDRRSTLVTVVAGRTVTRKSVHSIHTRSAIPAWGRVTLINVHLAHSPCNTIIMIHVIAIKQTGKPYNAADAWLGGYNLPVWGKGWSWGYKDGVPE